MVCRAAGISSLNLKTTALHSTHQCRKENVILSFFQTVTQKSNSIDLTPGQHLLHFYFVAGRARSSAYSFIDATRARVILFTEQKQYRHDAKEGRPCGPPFVFEWDFESGLSASYYHYLSRSFSTLLRIFLRPSKSLSLNFCRPVREPFMFLYSAGSIVSRAS